MEIAQAGILANVPRLGRYLLFSLTAPEAAADALRRLVARADGRSVVVGLGPALVETLGARVPGLREFPALAGPVESVPATPSALCCWLRAEGEADTGDLLLRSREIERALAPAFRLDQVHDSFRHGHGRDLTGYEDGTENPQGEDADAAALVRGQGVGLDGASFMALQQWVHDFDAFAAMSPSQQDETMGRRRSDNAELADAPASAHVKRTAQESFDPEAFVLRRSMPWAAGHQAGLMFVAFGRSFDAFEAQLRRMLGLDDGIADALFQISKPVSGAYFWCPPMRGGHLDLRALGL